MRALLLIALLTAAGPSAAAVVEQLGYDYYEVYADADQTLAEAINAASPVRGEGKRVFHGRTTWNINWHFRWRSDGNGKCRITRNDTTVSGTILLPDLKSASASQRRRFAAYLEALEEHELGHYAIAREAAARIDESILALPAARDCETLERTANERGHRLIDDYKRVEKQYDLSTKHGRSQGAWLED